MLVLEQNFAEEWAARAENHFVGRQLLLPLASQCHVREILVRQQTLESQAGTVLKLVPSQVEVLGVGHGEACQVQSAPSVFLVCCQVQVIRNTTPTGQEESLDNHN